MMCSLCHAFGIHMAYRCTATTTQVRENSTCGDRLTEAVANKLQFLTPKDYPSLFSGLSKAATAYAVAHDQEGAQVSSAAGHAIRRRRWLIVFIVVRFFYLTPSLSDSDNTTRAQQHLIFRGALSDTISFGNASLAAGGKRDKKRNASP